MNAFTNFDCSYCCTQLRLTGKVFFAINTIKHVSFILLISLCVYDLSGFSQTTVSKNSLITAKKNKKNSSTILVL